MIADQGNTAGVDPAEAFVCGLLHDLGKVALDAALPKSFDRVVEAADLVRGNIADLERNVIGLDHMVVGKRLAERGVCPRHVRVHLAARTAPSALPATVKNARLVNLVTLADAIAREQHLGYSGNYTFGVARIDLLTRPGLRRRGADRRLAEVGGPDRAAGPGPGIGRQASASIFICRP